MKKLVSVILVVVMLCGTFAGLQITSHALDSSGQCGENVTYTFDSGTGTVTISGTGKIYNYDYNNESPFAYEYDIKTVIINDGVTSIGERAFAGCENLTSITLGSDVASIAYDAFENCGGLTNISISPDNKTFDSRNNCNAVIETATNTLIMGCKNTLIPNTVTSIGERAFDYTGDSLTHITIPNSVTSIGAGAFSGCSLTSVTIPGSVTSIGDYAFSECYDLTSVTIENGVTSIGAGAFKWCSELINIAIPDSVKTICEEAFSGTAYYESYYEEESYWENDVLYIGNALIGAKESISGAYNIKNGTTCIADRAFYDCESLTSVTIPGSVTRIGEETFCYCSGLTNVTIENGVTDIEHWAFGACNSLTSITVPDSVTSIGDEAFYGTAYYNDESNWENGVLYIGNVLIKAKSSISGAYNIKSGTTCIAPNAFDSCYELTGIAIPGSVISIGDYAFYCCDGLTSVTIPDSVTSIGDEAFCWCSGLTSLTIGKGVKSIGRSAFNKCRALTSITIPDNVTSIGDYAFCNCTGLTELAIPGSVTSIGDSAFSGCRGLTSISVNPKNKYYDSRNNCNAIIETKTNTLITGCKNTIIPGTVKSIGDSAFNYCYGLTSITIPDSVTNIGLRAFNICSYLTSVTIPAGVKSIGDSAFYYCDSLKDVYYAGTEEEWNDISIGSGNNCLTNATVHFNSGGSGSDGIQYTVSTLAVTGGTMYLYRGGELAYSAESADGAFTLGDVANGIYDVYVSCKFGVLTKVPEQLTVDGTELSPASDVYIAIGDVNGDGLVDVSDISSILLDGIYATSNADYDIDGSGAVDINDVSTVLLATNYGASAAVVG